jgi:hypothetical protein
MAAICGPQPLAACVGYYAEQGSEQGPVRPVQLRSHVIGDHHGQAAGRTTVLVVAVDEMDNQAVARLLVAGEPSGR